MNEIEFLKEVSKLIFSGTYTVPFGAVNNVLNNLDTLIKNKETIQENLKKEESKEKDTEKPKN